MGKSYIALFSVVALVVTGVGVALCFGNAATTGSGDNSDNGGIENTSTSTPTTTTTSYSSLFHINHVPIFIVGDSSFTPANGVTSGSGTADDPYIIEGWAIDASSAHGIWIENTTKYFVISNCLVENGGTAYCGIYLDNVINGKVENNTCSNNRDGIHLRYSSYNNLISNTCENNYYYDIRQFSSPYNILENNTCGPNAEPFFTTMGVSQITTSSATIICATDENATCVVEYGTTTGYGLAQSDNTLVESHSIVLTGLSPGTTYHYRVKSKDALGNESVWEDTFTVLGFSMSTSQTSGSVVQGGSITATISLSPINSVGRSTGRAKSDSGPPYMTSISQIFNFSSTVSLSASGLPSGATASFDPPSGTPSFPSTFTISTDPTTPAGIYTITITATGGGVTHTCAYELTVTATTTTNTGTTTSPTQTGSTATPTQPWPAMLAFIGIAVVIIVTIAVKMRGREQHRTNRERRGADSNLHVYIDGDVKSVFMAIDG